MLGMRSFQPIALSALALAACGDDGGNGSSSTGDDTSGSTGTSSMTSGDTSHGATTSDGGTGGSGTTDGSAATTTSGGGTSGATTGTTDTGTTDTGATTGTTDTGATTGTTDTGATTGTTDTGTTTGTTGTGTSTGTPTGAYCGDGTEDPGEDCDDGNDTNLDGCDDDCTVSAGAKTVVTGDEHTCALFHTGAVRCWGRGTDGRLGYSEEEHIGDGETPASKGDVAMGEAVTQLAAGERHTCALLESGAVRCWGYGGQGRLGYQNEDNIGDGETPGSVGPVVIGGLAIQIVTGHQHTCALVQGGTVRCWGYGADGRLGIQSLENIGDGETPASVGPVDLGGTVTQLAAGGEHTCAIIQGGTVRCWGKGSYGRLGYEGTDDIGDGETPGSVGPVDIGGTVTELAAGGAHTCAILQGGTVRCWGYGGGGRLGYESTDNIGDTEIPGSVGPVDIGGTVVQITAGFAHTCALLQGETVRCFGFGLHGRLGYADTDNIGDTETPASEGDIDVGGVVTHIAAGGEHTCVRLNNSAVRCWGRSNFGQLGYSNTDTIGDGEDPSSVGEVPIY